MNNLYYLDTKLENLFNDLPHETFNSYERVGVGAESGDMWVKGYLAVLHDDISFAGHCYGETVYIEKSKHMTLRQIMRNVKNNILKDETINFPEL